MNRTLFHPLITRWFAEKFGEPSAPQADGWPHIVSGKDVLISAPTGSGKTLAAFLWSINQLVQKGLEDALEDKISVVYVSPLKALGNDIQINLQYPLKEIWHLANKEGVVLPEIRVAVRSGDTPARERRLMVRKPPHILITTPESLYILLTAERSRRVLETAETVIVDEIHAVAGDKRGAHLALSLERLDALCRRLQRIGLSATQKPIEEIARLLVGSGRGRKEGKPDCAIVDVGHQRDMDLFVDVPDQELGPITSHELWAEVYDRLTTQIKKHQTTIVFVNTRRLVERVSHNLTARLGENRVAAHHGSLSRKIRLDAERRLKEGEISAIVATASLELGIDVGHVDLVCHVGAPRSIATLLQRVGRSGHWKGALPKGILYPITRDELIQCAAAVRAVRRGELDQIILPEKPLDILSQQIVAMAASAEIKEEELKKIVRGAHHFRDLTEEELEALLHILAEGISTRRGRRSAYIHHDRINGKIKGRRGARLAAITSGGAIPDTADFDVIEEPEETLVGKVNEDFAIESLAGDIFLLGNKSWRIRRVETGKVRVEDAQGAPPNIPFWLGEAPARTAELSAALSDLRKETAERVKNPAHAVEWLVSETGVRRAGAEQIVSYIQETLKVLGTVPTQENIVAERFFDEAGGMQLVIHAPFGGRVNRAWGNTLRKCFCRTFDFELQAAATDDGIVLSLGEQHSFPLESAFGFVHPRKLKKDVLQATLQSPMFTTRWRWNAMRSLAILRHSGGRKVPVAIQRMRSEDLLAAVFPEQLGCQDNRSGDIEPPDHPLVNETIKDCFQEVMDVDGLQKIIERIFRGELSTRAVDTPAPSPMSHEILNANPYAFLDDAPLEERRARAVSLRRTLPDMEEEIGALDQEAIAEVCAQSWPNVRDPDELHDAMLSLCLLPLGEAGEWGVFAEELIRAGRVVTAYWPDANGATRKGYIAAERLRLARAALSLTKIEPEISEPKPRASSPEPTEAEALRAIVQGWMECVGPVTTTHLSSLLGLPEADVKIAMATLEGQGIVLRGRFAGKSNEDEIEWCDRRLLSRIHRLTLGRLRREIEAVSAADFIRFLFRWQHVHSGTQLHGKDGLLEIIGQLQGIELPAPAWEGQVLSSRIASYDPADLESLCLAGAVAWGRLKLGIASKEDSEKPNGARRRKLAPTRQAPLAFLLRGDIPSLLDPEGPAEKIMEGLSRVAGDTFAFLEKRGASFLTDITKELGHLNTAVEDALWELVSRGLVTGDGIAGLRALLMPEAERRKPRRRLQAIRGGRAPERFMPVGRWSLWRKGVKPPDNRVEAVGRQLLRRYGVVFREMVARETNNVPWRELLQVFRRFEARGEIRGGRFVNGFAGEQFALPEAVETLRVVRRKKGEDENVIVSASDPLNLVGILTPGARIPLLSNQVILFRDGAPADVGTLGEIRTRLQNQERAKQIST